MSETAKDGATNGEGTEVDQTVLENQIEIEHVDSNEIRTLPASPERDQWGSKVAYFLTLVGYAVGFGNIWRFPYQMRENGGFVFLIPYCLMLAILGIPIFFLELAVGQRRRKGVVYAWAEISPPLGGIGIACGWLCAMVGLYYNTLIAYCLSYFFDSFRNPLPWSDCNTSTSGMSEYKDCSEKLNNRSTKYYWFRKTLNISPDYDHPGDYSWWLLLYHVIAWGAVYAILVKGTKSVGAVVYITAVFPYLVLFIFFVANFCIDPGKAWLGAYRLLKPDWSKLYRPITWLKASSQLFFSLNLAEGCLVVFASYSPARNNCYKDAISISLINCGTSVFASLVVFPIIGLLGHQKYDECVRSMKDLFQKSKSMLALHKTLEEKYDIYFFTKATQWSEVDDLSNNITIRYGYGEISAEEKAVYQRIHHLEDKWEEIKGSTLDLASLQQKGTLQHLLRDCSIGQEATASGEGTGFVFQGFTEAVKNMPWPNFWCFLFFFMLLTLGIDSAFGTVEGVIASIEDITHSKRSVATAAVCAVMMIMSTLLFPFGWGTYILELLDQWAANWTYLVIALLECVAVAWGYGLAKMSYDVLLMTGEKPNIYMLLCWKYISPLMIAVMLIGSVVEFVYSTVQADGFKYTAFDPSHNDSKDGDVELTIPGHVLGIGFLLMLYCVLWVPLHFFLRKTKWNMLKEQAPADFPEEELREERNINVEREEDHFSLAEKAIIGEHSLHNLQEYRDKAVKSLTELQRTGSNISGLSLTKIARKK